LNNVALKLDTATDSEEGMVKDIYIRVLHVASKYVNDSKMFNLNLEYLKALDPDAAKLAKVMRTIADVMADIGRLSGSSQEIVANVSQCAWVMGEIADAISTNNTDLLVDMIQKLEQHSRAPVF
jgi:hypothetical protein